MIKQFQEFLKNGESSGARYKMAIPQQLPMGGLGSNIGKSVGKSLEFLDYRPYQPGDDLRHLDWGAFARSDSLIVKVFREEINPHVDILIDGSASMDLEGTKKAEAAISLAAFLASASQNSGFSHRAWLASNGCSQLINSNFAPTNWQGISFSWSDDISASLQKKSPEWKNRGIRIVISDLLWRVDPFHFLWKIANGAALTIVIQILNQEEIDGPEAGSYRLIDSETKQFKEILIDQNLINSYREKVRKHQQNWQMACKKYQGIFSFVSAESFLIDWKLCELLKSKVIQPT
ncbi:MAG: DUF58 domain-containing protein [Candidatus Riflebacteria bacterium]|nr:DUF58 domain-containing protein [Candidatus Riflebacteria bacterium]